MKLEQGIEKLLGERKAINIFIEYIDKRTCEEKPVYAFLNLPTGYGKSTLSLMLGRSAWNSTYNLFDRVIHVIPTRVLAEDICGRARIIGIPYAVQHMWAEPSVKAPYFIPRYVVTTYDSFMFNLYKVCVPEYEYDYGHYDVPRASILTSLVFFDEYHILVPGDSAEREYLSVNVHKRGWTALVSTIYNLSVCRVPIVLSSATYVKKAIDNIILSSFCKACKEIDSNMDILLVNLSRENQSRIRNISNIRIVEHNVSDKDFENSITSVRINTYVHSVKDYGELEKYVRDIVRENLDKRVAIIMNSVKLAQKIYSNLKYTHHNTILLHSRYTMLDRGRIQNRLIELMRSSNEKFVLIATQVVEVGINLDVDIMITEIAPITSLVQRCGRVARDPEVRSIDNAEIHVILIGENMDVNKGLYSVYRSDITLKTYDELRSIGNIEWRLPYDTWRGESYVKIAESVYNNIELEEDGEYRRILIEIFKNPLIDMKDVKNILKKLLSFIRDDIALPLFVPPEPVDHICVTNIVERYVNSRDIQKFLVPIEAKILVKNYKNLLLIDNNKVYALYETENGEIVVDKDENLYEIFRRWRENAGKLLGYVKHNGNERLYLIAPILKYEAYSRDLGLIIGY